GELRPSAVSDAAAAAAAAAADDDDEDIETGLDAAADAKLAAFNRKADAIEKVFVWADRSIRTITNDLSDPDALPSLTAQLDTIDNKLDAVRKHLGRIADENTRIAAEPHAAPATLRHRVNRFTKLSRHFMQLTAQMEAVRERHRHVLTDGVKRDIVAANPHATDRQVERALQHGDLHAVLHHQHDAQLHHQIDDLRARNNDIQKLSTNIVQLHKMFTDMSLLVDNQQELINGIEYNVKEVHQTTKKAADELLIARNHQKAARKKKACCIISVIVILLAIAAGIIIWQGLKNNWFGGGGGGDNNNNNNDNSNNNIVESGNATARAIHYASASFVRADELRPTHARANARRLRTRWYD
ncbi:unnamed protein product, partial [Agarophyton chilense]